MTLVRNTFLLVPLAMALGVTPLAAQDALSFGMKTSAGPTYGDAAKLLTDGPGYAFGFDVQADQKFSAFSLVYSAGIRFYPGRNNLLSSIPSSLPAGTNPSVFESRMQKIEAQTWQFGVVARKSILIEGLYAQGGLRLGFGKMTNKHTGTQLITNGTAIANPNASSPNILAINTIAEESSKKTLNPALTAGIGYSFNDLYSIEVNLQNFGFTDPRSNQSKGGFSAEFAFGVRF